jgi:aspartyl-tRNA(Asn)/glutamyl-tRNA(Gln) amidotransferase subunit A
MNLTNLSVQQIAAKINEKEFSPAELGAALSRRGTHAQKELTLFISFDPQSIAREIKRIEQNVQVKNNRLLGVPVALADNISTGDQKTTCASRLLASYQPPFEARVVSLLKESGALLTGKTNLEEFGLGCSGESSFLNQVKNPWDKKYTAGSGAAAAVASGLTTLALASDARGELRQAASYCGIMALKPTYGRISRKGLIDCASSLEQLGILARRASDLALTLQVLAGPEADNPTTLPTEAPPYADLLEKISEKPRIAVPACWDEAPYLEDEVKKNFQEQLAKLGKLGLEINFVTLPHFQYAYLVATIICAVEAFSNLSNLDGVRFGYRKEGKHLQEMYIKTRSQGFSSKLKKFLTFGGLLSTAKYYHNYFLQGQKMRSIIKKELEDCLQENELLLTPTTPFKAIPAGSPLSGKELPDPASYYTAAANLTGFPSLSFPINTGGLPYGLQFMAKRENEVILLQVASLLEKEDSIKWPKFALELQEV